jgi:hypothetical protein
MGVVRGLAIAPDMGGRRCYAVEVAFDVSDDYAHAVSGRVVNDDCQQRPVAFQEGSGVCAFHRAQIRLRERGRAIE